MFCFQFLLLHSVVVDRMADNQNQVQRVWEERVICQAKGRRIVHYILRDSTRNSLLAVVGIERSINHMMYTPTRDYLHAFGYTRKVHAGTRWKSRKVVTRFLKSVASRGGSIFPVPSMYFSTCPCGNKWFNSLSWWFTRVNVELQLLCYNFSNVKLLLFQFTPSLHAFLGWDSIDVKFSRILGCVSYIILS